MKLFLIENIVHEVLDGSQNPLNHNPENSVSLLEGANETAMWYERIPSSANPADLLSRFAVHEACKRFLASPRGMWRSQTKYLSSCGARFTIPNWGDAIATAIRVEADLMAEVPDVGSMASHMG